MRKLILIISLFSTWISLGQTTIEEFNAAIKIAVDQEDYSKAIELKEKRSKLPESQKTALQIKIKKAVAEENFVEAKKLKNELSILEQKQKTGLAIDIDGNVYKTVVIGDQEWFAENLKVDVGKSIVKKKAPESGRYYSYPSILADTGYTGEAWEKKQYALKGTIELCPAGWRVPTHKDWSRLLYFDDQAVNYKSTEGWPIRPDKINPEEINDRNGTDKYSFNGLPDGYYLKEDRWETHPRDYWIEKGYLKDKDFQEFGAPIVWSGDNKPTFWSSSAGSFEITTNNSDMYLNKSVNRVSDYFYPIRCMRSAKSGAYRNQEKVEILAKKKELESILIANRWKENSQKEQESEIQLLNDKHNSTINGIVKTVIEDGMTDIDGVHYNVMQIGDQYWTIDNIYTSQLIDRTKVNQQNEMKYWKDTTATIPLAMCWYEFNEATKKSHGALYTWKVIESDSICPTHWHVPDQDEVDQLKKHVADNKLQSSVTSYEQGYGKYFYDSAKDYSKRHNSVHGYTTRCVLDKLK